MAFILPKASSLAQNISTGLGSGLEALAQQKLQQIQQRNMAQQLAKGLEQGYGYSPEQAQVFTQLPPELQQQAFKQKLQAPQQQAFAQLLGQLQGGPGQPLNIPEGAGLSEKQALDLAKFGQKERQIGTAEAKEARKYLEPHEEKYQEAKKSIEENNQLITLAQSGNLRAGTSQQILDRLHLGDFWRPIENELAQKNLARQAQNAGAAFNTSRLTNLDVNLYKNSLGTLWNTPEGLKSIAQINKLEAKALKVRHDERRKIIRENKGKIPFDIETQVDERVGNRLKTFAERAMNIITRGTAKLPTEFGSINEIKKAGYGLGTKIIDDETGIEYTWDGNKLIKG